MTTTTTASSSNNGSPEAEDAEARRAAVAGQKQYLREATRGLRLATAKYEAARERQALRQQLRNSQIAQEAGEKFYEVGTGQSPPLVERARQESALSSANTPSPSRIPILRGNSTAQRSLP